MPTDNPTSAAKEWPVAEWAATEKTRRDDFVNWWQHNQIRDAAMFPATMPLGGWDEQYRCWLGG